MTTVQAATNMLSESGFLVEDKRPERDYLVVKCTYCSDTYSLDIKSGEVHALHVLGILDHMGGHVGAKEG